MWQYTALTYSFPYLEPVRSFMPGSNCCLFTCIQISQEAGKVVWYANLLKNFPEFVVIHTVKGFSIVNKAEGDVLLEFSFSMIQQMSAICSLVHLPFKNPAWTSSLNIWKFLIHVLLKTSLENFEISFASMWNEYTCVVVWTFFGIAFLLDWNENCVSLYCTAKWIRHMYTYIYIYLLSFLDFLTI